VTSYRIVTLDGRILGHRKTYRAAEALALRKAHRLAVSVEILKRNRDGVYEQVTIAFNPWKFVY